MCNNCIHQPVCSIYRATGGVKKCEHHKEELKGEWLPFGRIELKCSNCGFLWFLGCQECGVSPDNTSYCPMCGADMRGAEDG